jgi:hypothetical protein
MKTRSKKSKGSCCAPLSLPLQPGYFPAAVQLSAALVVVLIYGLVSLSPLHAAAAGTLTWTLNYHRYTDKESPNSIQYVNGRFVAPSSYSNQVITSTDGMNWTEQEGSFRDILCVTYGNGLYVAVGNYGKIMTSTDGMTWSNQTWGKYSELYDVTYGNGLYVAVGNYGVVITSTDGITWTQLASAANTVYYDVDYCAGMFVVAGSGGLILTSTDGTSWSNHATGFEYNFSCVAYGGGVFVAAGFGGAVMTSTDGATWKSQKSGVTDHINDLAYGGGTFVAVVSGGTILTSTDGMVWQQSAWPKPSGDTYSNSLFGVDYGNGVFVGLGRYGRILTSGTVGSGTVSNDTVTATPTASKVLVNGKPVSFDAYTIGGNNYFKLRDIAYTLSGTDKKFEVSWDSANNAILITQGKAYTAVGGEMTASGMAGAQAAPTAASVYIDESKVNLTDYTINGYNYFKLRDLGKALDFGVTWDGVANTISIDTSAGYTA